MDTHIGAIRRCAFAGWNNKKTGGTDFERKETENLSGWKIFVVVIIGSFYGTCLVIWC